MTEPHIPLDNAGRAAIRTIANEGKAPDRDADGLFRRYSVTHDPRLREQLVAMHQNLVRYLASKFVNRGEPLEDLLKSEQSAS